MTDGVWAGMARQLKHHRGLQVHGSGRMAGECTGLTSQSACLRSWRMRYLGTSVPAVDEQIILLIRSDLLRCRRRAKAASHANPDSCIFLTSYSVPSQLTSGQPDQPVILCATNLRITTFLVNSRSCHPAIFCDDELEILRETPISELEQPSFSYHPPLPDDSRWAAPK